MCIREENDRSSVEACRLKTRYMVKQAWNTVRLDSSGYARKTLKLKIKILQYRFLGGILGILDLKRM